MTGYRVKVITRTIYIRWHDGDKFLPILLINLLAKFHSCYFRYCISLISRFYFSIHKILFLHGLRRAPRVYATTSEKYQFLYISMKMCSSDKIILNNEVFIEHISWVFDVSWHPQHLRCSDNNILRITLSEKIIGSFLIKKIQLTP